MPGRFSISPPHLILRDRIQHILERYLQAEANLTTRTPREIICKREDRGSEWGKKVQKATFQTLNFSSHRQKVTISTSASSHKQSCQAPDL